MIKQLNHAFMKEVEEWKDILGIPCRCPICRREVQFKYYQKWNTWEVSCRSFFRKPHFIYTGKPGWSRIRTIREYNSWRSSTYD